METLLVDRYGNCPCCEKSWKSNDVFQELNSMDVFHHKSEIQVKNIAANFGWLPERKNWFSDVIVHEFDGVNFFECPNNKCRKLFNTITGEIYLSLYSYKIGEKSYAKIAGIITVLPEQLKDFSEIEKEQLQQEIEDCPFNTEPTKTETNGSKEEDRTEKPVSPKQDKFDFLRRSLKK